MEIGEDKEAERAFEELLSSNTVQSYYRDRAQRELEALVLNKEKTAKRKKTIESDRAWL